MWWSYLASIWFSIGCVCNTLTSLHRRFLLFPRGNNVNDMVSLYIEVVKDKETDPDWHVCAQFALFISNPHDPTNYIHNGK
jgi:hypothetical protein